MLNGDHLLRAGTARFAGEETSACGRSSTHRPGFTLAELVVVLVLGTLVLALVAAIGNRLQRDLAASAGRIASMERLRAAAAILPLDWRSLSMAAGDIRPGEARDTSVEFRATIASAIVCGSSGREVMLAPLAGADGRFAGAAIDAADTIWVLEDSDSAESWRAIRAGTVRPGPEDCPALATGDDGANRIIARRRTLAVDIGETHASSVARGAPVRVTRPMRYSFYRAGDGWYLGLRTWNAAAARFASIQPVSGPYVAPTAAGGTRLRYFDARGAPIAAGTMQTGTIARIDVSLHTTSADPRRARLNDSLTLVVAPRNRW